MGKATGWLRGLLGGKKKTGSEGKERKGWGLVRSLRDGGNGKANRKKARETPRCNACGGNPGVGKAVVGDDEEQSKRAIAVATATAAAAEAAVAAAQAAAAVVRLTSSCGGAGTATWRSDEWAAVKIQSAFRGYLARRALKALKGLVKIQALVRGHIVRKQAAETLRCMHALVRAQARARAGRVIDPRSGKKGSRRHSLMREQKDSSGLRNIGTVERRVQHSSGWNRVEDRYWDSRESASRNSKTTDEEQEEDEKILEIDAGRPHGNPKWRSVRHSTCYADPTSRRMPDSPSKDSTTVVQDSMLPSPSSSVKMQPSLSSLMFPLEGAECTTESPMFYSASSRSRRGSFAPSKSSFFGGYADHPNYMANTESSRAKVRSQSAPRQRSEFDKSTGYASQVQSGGGGGSGSSSQRSLHLKFAGKAYPGSGRLDRMGMPLRI